VRIITPTAQHLAPHRRVGIVMNAHAYSEDQFVEKPADTNVY